MQVSLRIVVNKIEIKILNEINRNDNENKNIYCKNSLFRCVFIPTVFTLGKYFVLKV